MTAPIVIFTQGTTVTVTPPSGSPTAIGGANQITGIGSGSAKEIATTNLLSTAVEHRPGLPDFGTAKIALVPRNQDDAGQLACYTAWLNQSVCTWIITLPQSSNNICTFQGYVMQMTSDIGTDDIVKGEISVRITGAAVWT